MWGFREGDIIEHVNPFGWWVGKKIKIKKINPKEGKLWGVCDSAPLIFTEPWNLVLLERSGLEFKVGDVVHVTDPDDLRFKREKGRVIVLAPETTVFPDILLEMENVDFGHNGNTYFFPWFPESEKKPEAKNRFWFAKCELRII